MAGILEIGRQGHGFVRVSEGEDVYISASQIRRCELRSGDHVEGPARPARRGERHPALVRVDSVNGAEPVMDRATSFDQLTPVAPHRRIPLAPASDDVLVRAADLLVPLAHGQRLLITAQQGSGRTTLLRGLVAAIAAAPDPPTVVVLLVDERPEEVTEWNRQTEGAEIAAAPADLSAADQVRHAELTLAKAKRRVEAGEDVVLIVDSLSRLGFAYGEAAAAKPFFGAGRELEEEGSGSLTVIATVLTETSDGVAEAVETTENAHLALDPDLAADGILPGDRRLEVLGHRRGEDPRGIRAGRRSQPPWRAAGARRLRRGRAAAGEDRGLRVERGIALQALSGTAAAGVYC